MNTRIQPSERARAICREYYPDQCHRCPLGRECHHWEPTHSQEQLDAKVERINKLAEEAGDR